MHARLRLPKLQPFCPRPLPFPTLHNSPAEGIRDLQLSEAAAGAHHRAQAGGWRPQVHWLPGRVTSNALLSIFLCVTAIPAIVLALSSSHGGAAAGRSSRGAGGARRGLGEALLGFKEELGWRQQAQQAERAPTALVEAEVEAEWVQADARLQDVLSQLVEEQGSIDLVRWPPCCAH